MGTFLVQIDDDLFQPATTWNLAKQEVSGVARPEETTWHNPTVQETVIKMALKQTGMKRVTIKLIEEPRPEVWRVKAAKGSTPTGL
ncbi:MAG: hypothetical protein JO356_13345 [Acidobacteria bacterium]|nr:hypothetical protein [Acidobacteriota bacterium]